MDLGMETSPRLLKLPFPRVGPWSLERNEEIRKRGNLGRTIGSDSGAAGYGQGRGLKACCLKPNTVHLCIAGIVGWAEV